MHQAYLGGHGTDEHKGGAGVVTNFKEGGCNHICQENKVFASTRLCPARNWVDQIIAHSPEVPWSSPGQAPVFGGGCGVFGGNPYGCPAHLDTRVSDPTKGRKNDIKCGQPSMGYNRRGTFAFGSDARELEFPQMRTTEWARYKQLALTKHN